MATARKHEGRPASSSKPKMSEAERKFFQAIEKPKPAPEYLKKMFRLYGTGAPTKKS